MTDAPMNAEPTLADWITPELAATLNEPIDIPIHYPNPLEDNSAWVLIGQRYEPDWDSYEYLGAQLEELMQQRPIDDPTRQLWEALKPWQAQRPHNESSNQ